MLSRFSCVRLFLDCSLPSSSLCPWHSLEWVAMPSSRESSRPRDQTRVSYISCIGRSVLYTLVSSEKSNMWDTTPERILHPSFIFKNTLVYNMVEWHTKYYIPWKFKNHGTLFKQNNSRVLFPLKLLEHHVKKLLLGWQRRKILSSSSPTGEPTLKLLTDQLLMRNTWRLADKIY